MSDKKFAALVIVGITALILIIGPALHSCSDPCKEDHIGSAIECLHKEYKEDHE